LKPLQLKPTKFWVLASACLLMVVTGAVAARAAFEGQTRTAAPPWMSLFGVAISPDGNIFVVGSKALLLVSTDHGKTWIQQTLKERAGSVLFQDRDLYSIRFAPNSKVGWIVGEEGTILHTDDGGQTWSTQKSGTDKNLMKICAIDDQTAIAVGADSAIVRTTDGGATWQTEKLPKPMLITLFDVRFPEKNMGWITGEFSTILSTTDGGQNWTLVTGGNTTDFTVGPFFTIAFTDPQHGTAAGLSGDISVTSDGGKTWQPQKLPDPAASYVVTEDPTDKKLWAVGNGGKMFEQSPGDKWKEATRATFQDLTDIAFAGNQGVAVGLNGTILLSENAGEQWQVVQ